MHISVLDDGTSSLSDVRKSFALRKEHFQWAASSAAIHAQCILRYLGTYVALQGFGILRAGHSGPATGRLV
jgi:hypothetical protein